MSELTLIRGGCFVLLLAAAVGATAHGESANAGTLRALQTTNSTAAVLPEARQSWNDPFWLVVGVFALRTSDWLLGAIRCLLGPERKVVVLSCP